MTNTTQPSPAHCVNELDDHSHEHMLLVVSTTVDLDDMDAVLVGPPQVADSCGLSDPVVVGFDPATLEAVVIFTLDPASTASAASTAELAYRVERLLCDQGFPPPEAVERCKGHASCLIRDYWAEAASLAEEHGEPDRYCAALLPKPALR